MRPHDALLLLLDANVLIDLLNIGEESLIATIAGRVGGMSIAEQTRQKVEGVSEDKCRGLLLEITEPTLEELFHARSLRAEYSGLADDDAISLSIALARGLTLVSNDKLVGNVARRLSAKHIRAFRLLKVCTDSGLLTIENALRLATAWIDANPWLPQDLLGEVEVMLKE